MYGIVLTDRVLSDLVVVKDVFEENRTVDQMFRLVNTSN